MIKPWTPDELAYAGPGHLGARAAEEGLSGLERVRAGFLAYEHAGPPADAVHTRHALHRLPDFLKAAALDRVARIVRPGGVLRPRDLISDFRPADADAVFGRRLDGAAGDPAPGHTRDDYAGHLRAESSAFRWLLEPMLDAAGFEIVEADFGSRCTAPARASGDEVTRPDRPGPLHRR